MRALVVRSTAVLLLAVVACRRAPPTLTPLRAARTEPGKPHAAGAPGSPAPLADAALATAVDASVPPPEPEDDHPASWTAPTVLAELARDCRYLPRAEDDETLAALRCDYDLHPQSCTADPCDDHVNQPCRTVCGNQCEGCDQRCRSACAACRRGCADDACRAACAASCGACLQTCLTSRDRCLTAVCGTRYEACSRRYNADFDRRCLPVCRRCEQRCTDSDTIGQCVQRCARRGGCTADQAGDCAFTGAVVHEHPEGEGDGAADGGA